MAIFNSKSKEEYDRLIKENEELRNSLHKSLNMAKSLDDLEEKLAETRSKLSELSKEEKTLVDFIQKTNEDKINKSYFIAEMDKKISELQNTKNNLENTIENFTKEAAELEKKNENGRRSIDELDTQIGKKKSEFEEMNLKVDERKQDLSASENRALELAKDRKELEELFEENNTKIEFHSKQIQDMENKAIEITNNNNIMLADINKLKAEIDKLIEERNDLENSIADFTKQELIKEKRIKELDEKISKNEGLKFNLDQNLSTITDQLGGKDKLFSDYQARKDKLTEEISIAINTLANTSKDIKAGKAEIADNQEVLRAVENKRDVAREEIENFEQIKSEISESLVKKREEENKLMNDVNLLKKEISKLEDKKFETEESNLKLEKGFQNTFNKFEIELREAKNDLTSMKQLNINKNREIKEKDDLLLAKNTELSEYTGIVKVLRREKDSIEEANEKLSKRKDEYNENILLLKEELNSLKLEMNNITIETESLLLKKNLLEKELADLLIRSTKEFTNIQTKNEELSTKLIYHKKEQKELDDEIELRKDELTELFNQLSKSEIDKEEYSVKISQLISLEKSFQSKIDDYNSKIDKIESEALQNNSENTEINIDKDSGDQNVEDNSVEKY